MTSIGPYSASGVGKPSLTNALSKSRNQLDDLLQQLSSGKVSQTYAGLGSGRTTSLAMRSKLSAIESFQATSATVDIRVKQASGAVSRLEALGAEYKTVDPNEYQLTSGGRTIAQSQAGTDLQEAIAQLNSDVNGRYLFSGRSTDTKPVLSADAILSDDGDKAGLRTVIEERRLADLGADGRGRIDVEALAPGDTSFDVSQEASGPFGFKITSLASNLANGVATGPTGAANTLTLGVTGAPSEGQTVRIGLTLPDGTTEEIVLTAREPGAQPFGPGDFRIGATPEETTANMRAAFDGALQTEARTSLTAASAFQAGEEFFNTPAGTEPQRVAGFDGVYGTEAARVAALQGATGLDSTGTAALTVDWYQGEDAGDDPRTTAAARIDDGVTVSYGARANEDGTRRVVQTLAVFSSMQLTESDPDAQARYRELATRTIGVLGSTETTGDLKTMTVELADASTAIKAATSRQVAARGVAEDAIAGVEDISDEEVSLKILSLETRLSASYQATAILKDLSLVNFI